MSAQAGSVSSLLSALLLSDHRILQLAWDEPFVRPLEFRDLRERTYLAYQPWAARYPDHVFDAAWRSLTAKQRPGQCVLLTVLHALVDEFLEYRHGSIHVRRPLFGAWQQGLISRISALPIRAMADVKLSVDGLSRTGAPKSLPILARDTGTLWNRKTLALLRPFEAAVDDYVAREGLHETHMHLNGSTHAEICWLRAMRNPQAETEKFAMEWRRGKHVKHIRELVSQVNPSLSPTDLFHHLRAASRLRAWLVSAAESRGAPDMPWPASCALLCAGERDEWSRGLHEQFQSWRQELDIADELEWQASLIERLTQFPSVQLERMFHSYLLLQNQYYRLMVQSETQYGFDQFQKLTYTELREPAERDYLQRFYSSHGGKSGTSTTGYLEGRFAPKSTRLKTYQLLHAILSGYLSYLRGVTDRQQPTCKPDRSLSRLLNELEKFFSTPHVQHRSIQRLALVAHFIKQPWSPEPTHKAGPYRDYALDLQLRRSTGVLLAALRRWPQLCTWVRGIDAAANELHAPPAPFAPAFRVCQRAGLSHRSFHAGEDFPHLLTGMAYMWDTLNLLSLRDGDRIGHGTAMGISPTLWLKRMPSRLNLSRGDWMLGVLAAWQLLREVPEMHACVQRLQLELEETACQVFGTWLPAARVERAMALRGLCRQTLHKYYAGFPENIEESLSDHWLEEITMVRTAIQQQPEDVDLLWKWLSERGAQKRANELIDKDAAFLDAPAYVQLQQALMRHVAERGVLIETLPSSNVRISQYLDFAEHHSLRWMRVPGHIEEGDPEIMVCLGSDDPGIFAGDLETEFHQLYAALRATGLGDSESLERLKKLNERGRIYRFHHRSLS